MMKVRVGTDFWLSASHQIDGHHKCGVIHGHNYKVRVELSGLVLPKTTKWHEAMVIDFKMLRDKIWHRVLDKYDHADLNQALGYNIPTVELMAVRIFHEIEAELQDIVTPAAVILEEVVIWETEKSYARFTRDDFKNS
jgi:6-pyruvoyltetrahydropterin/6-carboxytetrahydropterin synthase